MMPQVVVSSPASSTSTLSEDPSTLSAVNAQLLSHGWTKQPLNLGALGETDYADVVSVLFALLSSNVTNLDNIDALSARHRTLNYEHERLQKSLNSSKTTNVKLQTEMAGWKARCAELEKRLGHEEVKVKELREEVGRGKKALEGVRVAASHDSKKAQTRMDKAQAQLLKMSNDATTSARPHGLVILNPIHPGRGIPVAPNQSPLLEQTIRDLVEIRHALQEETESFRRILVATGNNLRELLAEASGEDAPPRLMHSQFFCALPNKSTRPGARSQAHTHQTATSASHASLAEAHLQSLISQLRAQIHSPPPARLPEQEAPDALSEEEIEEKKRVEREASRVLATLEERVKDLEVEVSCAKAREDEAKKLVEEYVRVHAETRAAQVIGDEGDLEKQRNDLEAERKAFSEATQRLGEERRRLEGERRALLEEKKRWTGDFMGSATENVSPIVKPPAASSSSGNAEAGPSTATTAAQVPHKSPWRNFEPASPSPLSPGSAHKMRSPRTHVAGGGRRKMPKTPLSRLVLEKAVLHRDRTATTSTSTGGVGNVFGAESSRRANIDAGHANVTERRDSKGKTKDGLKGSTTVARTLAQSTLAIAAKRDVAVPRGSGAAAAAAAAKPTKVWR